MDIHQGSSYTTIAPIVDVNCCCTIDRVVVVVVAARVGNMHGMGTGQARALSLQINISNSLCNAGQTMRHGLVPQPPPPSRLSLNVTLSLTTHRIQVIVPVHAASR